VAIDARSKQTADGEAEGGDTAITLVRIAKMESEEARARSGRNIRDNSTPGCRVVLDYCVPFFFPHFNGQLA